MGSFVSLFFLGALILVGKLLKPVHPNRKPPPKPEPKHPSRGMEGEFAASIWLRTIVSAVVIVGLDELRDEDPISPVLLWGARAAIAFLWFPSVVLASSLRLRLPRLVGFYARIFPPWSGSKEVVATSLFYEAVARFRDVTPDEAQLARIERRLGTITGGPVALATRALLLGLRGRLEECHAMLEDVLVLEGRSTELRLPSLRGRIPRFVRRIAVQELVFSHLATGRLRPVVRLPELTHDPLARFAAAAARRILEEEAAPTDATLVVLHLLSSAPLRTLPLLRMALAIRPRGPIEAPPMPTSAEEILGRGFALGHMRCERERIAEAITLAQAWEHAIASGSLRAQCERRLDELGSIGTADGCIEALATAFEDVIARGTEESSLRRSTDAPLPPLLEERVGERIDAAWKEMRDHVREFSACAADEPIARYARAARAFRHIRATHARLVELDPSQRGDLFGGPLVTVWNRAIAVGEAEGNWLLAYAVFVFLADEANALHNGKQRFDLTGNAGLFA